MITITRTYNVTFIGDYFYLSTTLDVPVSIDDNDDRVSQVIAYACDFIDKHYGWDVLDAATVAVDVVEV